MISNLGSTPGPVYDNGGVAGGSGGLVTLSVQIVTATAQTWNGTAGYVVLDSSAMGPGATFLLPAISGIPLGRQVTIKNEDGANAVAITPNGTDKIDETNAAISTGALRMAVTLTARPSVSNWMID